MKGTTLYATLFRTAALTLMLAAASASAKPKKPAPQAKPVKALVTEAPKNCKEQCDIVEKVCADPCKTIKNKQAKTSCQDNCQQMTAICYGSCKKKGRIDEKYMMENIKPPRPPAGVKVVEDDDDHH